MKNGTSEFFGTIIAARNMFFNAWESEDPLLILFYETFYLCCMTHSAKCLSYMKYAGLPMYYPGRQAGLPGLPIQLVDQN